MRFTNKYSYLTLLIVLLLIIVIILTICGCSNTSNSKTTLFHPNLQPIIEINSSIGAIGRYNYNRLNSLSTTIPNITTSIPQTQIEYQQYKVINNKLGKYYE